eukprot:gene56363-48550_t
MEGSSGSTHGAVPSVAFVAVVVRAPSLPLPIRCRGATPG